jgi:hypothetical protein
MRISVTERTIIVSTWLCAAADQQAIELARALDALEVIADDGDRLGAVDVGVERVELGGGRALAGEPDDEVLDVHPRLGQLGDRDRAQAQHVADDLVHPVGVAGLDERSPLVPFWSRTIPAISRLRRASRRAFLPTPSCSASSRSGGSLSPGRSVPAAIWARMRSQISSKARRVRIGSKVGAARGAFAIAGGERPVAFKGLDGLIDWLQ